MLAPHDLFDLDGDTHAFVFAGVKLVWEVLDQIKEYTANAVAASGPTGELLRAGGEVLGATVVLHQGRAHDSGFELLGGDPTKGEMRVRLGGRVVTDAAVVHAGAVFMSGDVHLAPGAKVEPGALMAGPCYIGPCSEVRQGAYLRGSCLVGAGCVVGHATEMKNSVMLDGAKAGHFAYLGDSVLGRGVNLGAGTKLANLKMLDRPHRIRAGAEVYTVERRKFGAIMGDGCETGCNCVTNPGVVMGKRSLCAPCLAVAPGYHPPKSILR
jgi:bifunctional N-acetylglucosamine-1-phosphate-uridyltransferase/glucosamine-1-phosphate-acetyltransferase GlmU-like protein